MQHKENIGDTNMVPVKHHVSIEIRLHYMKYEMHRLSIL